jgi:hypothetical protein
MTRHGFHIRPRPDRPAKPKAVKRRGLCRACGIRSGNRSGVLCHRCWSVSQNRHEVQPVANTNAEPTKMPTPTDVPPGPARADVYAARHAAGEALHHPDDVPGDREGQIGWRLPIVRQAMNERHRQTSGRIMAKALSANK